MVKMKNIIIRIATGKKDVTMLASRADYIHHMKNSKVIFAIEYPTEEKARQEITGF